MKRFLLLFTFMVFTLLMYAQVTKTVTLATAGTLATTLTATELSTVSNLTLGGTIDARDFKTMRDLMPVLAVLDMSQATIAEYNGSGGTFGGSYTYLANSIPIDAFNTSDIFYSLKLTSINIPASVTVVENSAFHNCKSLISITFTNPSSLASIGNMAFQYCEKLTSFSIPASVTSIGNQVFYGTSASISVDVNNTKYSSLDGVLFNKDKTNLIYCPQIKIGNYTIPSTVTIIDENAFRYCSSLTAIAMSPNLTAIGDGAFASCSQLTTISLPKTVSSIGDYAFYSCYGLTSFYVDRTTPVDLSSVPGVFSGGNQANCTLYVPVGSESLYAAAPRWKNFGNIVGNKPNQSPTANAGTGQTVNEGSVVTLDGSASTDADSDALTYLWTAPAGITLSSTTSAKPTFTAPMVSVDTSYTITLVVNDGKVNSTSSSVVVLVKQVAPSLTLTSKLNNVIIPVANLLYRFFKKNGASFAEKSIQPVINGNVAKFDLESGEWIVLVSPKSTSAFTPTYSGNVANQANAVAIAIPESGTVSMTIDCLVWTGFDELLSVSLFKIYPNPVTGPVTIDLSEDFDLPALITIYSTQGSQVLQQQLDGKKTIVNLSNLLTGSYLVKVNSGNKSQSKVLVKN